MATLFGELFFGLVRLLVTDLVESFFARIGHRFMVWLHPMVRGRAVRFIVGGLLGLAAYVALPILLSLLP